MKIWCDGSGWNGKVSRWAIVCEDGEIYHGEWPVKRTNNEMEYIALILALHIFSPDDVFEHVIYIDSQLVYNQILNKWKIAKPHLAPLSKQARNLYLNTWIDVGWIPRKKNLAGRFLDGKVI